ncbi:hypothetical protein GSF22_17555, partial [Micromonospora echinofusca]|nr:hypothetical protein [Micromonospora echinofusca]
MSGDVQPCSVFASSSTASDPGRCTQPAQPAWGIGLATVTADEQVLDTWY